MSDTYVECLIKAKASTIGKLVKGVLIALTVGLGLLALMGIPVGVIGAVLTGVGAYFMHLYTDVEYEYLYLDKELTVDRVLAKTMRKRMGTFTLERMEILAPIHSHHLDSYKNRNVKVKDYSVGEERKPDERYALYYEGGEKLILSPSEDLVKVIRNVSPRKVFMD